MKISYRVHAVRRMFERRGAKPLHVVAAYNAQGDEQIVVTVYEPDPALWDDGFKRRKP